MARSVTDLALLLSVQAGYDPRAPLSLDGDGAGSREPLDGRHEGQAHRSGPATLAAPLPYEPGVLDLCKSALKTSRILGCIVEEARPDFPFDALWHAFTTLRAWQTGGALARLLQRPGKRAR